MSWPTRSRRVMELARSEASMTGGGVVGTEHLLMRLALLDDGLASEALRESGVGAAGGERTREKLRGG